MSTRLRFTNIKLRWSWTHRGHGSYVSHGFEVKRTGGTWALFRHNTDEIRQIRPCASDFRTRRLAQYYAEGVSR